MIRLAVSMIALSLFVMGLSVALLKGFENAVKEKVQNLSADLVLTAFHTEDSYTTKGIDINKISPFLDTTKIESFEKFAYQPGLISGKFYSQAILAKGVNPETTTKKWKNYLNAGTWLSSNSEAEEIVISQKIAKNFDLKLGDSLSIFLVKEDKQYHKIRKIIGIYETGLPEIDEKIVFLPLTLLQKFNAWMDEDLVGGLEFFLKPNVNLILFQKQLSYQLAYSYWLRNLQEIYPHLFDWLSLLYQHVFLILVLMFILGLIHVLAILLILIFENQERIRLLYQLGMSLGQIRKIFVQQVFWVLTRALLFGNLALIIVIFLQQKFHFLTLNPDIYFIPYMAVEFDIFYLILINFSIIGLSYLFLHIIAQKVLK